MTGSHKFTTEKLIKSLTESQTDLPDANSSKDLFQSFHQSQGLLIKFSYQ